MKNMYKKAVLSILFLFGVVLACFAQNPTIVNGVATYHTSINIKPKFPVPLTWNKIVINANVTITGSFYLGERTTPIEIMGKNRKTSIIQGDGSRPTNDFAANGEPLEGKSYSAIRADLSPNLYVHDLTITKPMRFHVDAGMGNVSVERCDITSGSDKHTTGGIHGGIGKAVIKDCYINVFDDALYTVECKLVENTTIVHNSKGGPFMTSWGEAVPEDHTCVVRNCKVIGNSTGSYAHGVFSWAQKNYAAAQTIHIKIEGSFDYSVSPGKAASPMYTIAMPYSNNPNEEKPPVVKNATMNIDGKSLAKSSVELRPTAENCKVVFENFDNSNYVFIDHSASSQRLRGFVFLGTQSGGAGDMVQWGQQPTDNGYFFLIHKGTGKKIQASPTFAVDLVNPSENGLGAQWKWIDAGSGWYRLENRAYSRWLHNDGVIKTTGDTEAGGTTVNWTVAPKTVINNNTKFKFSEANSGKFALKMHVAKTKGNKISESTSNSNSVSTFLSITGVDPSNIVEIYDNKGQKVMTIQGKSEIDISSLASGTYFVRLEVTTKLKFVKD